MWKLAIPLFLLALYGCGAFHQGYNHSYHNMPPPLALYFDNGVRHLSFSAKLAVLDRVDYMNSNPDLKAEIVGYAKSPAARAQNAALAEQLTHIVEKEFLDQGISPRRLKIVPVASDKSSNTRPHVAIRLKGVGS